MLDRLFDLGAQVVSAEPVRVEVIGVSVKRRTYRAEPQPRVFSTPWLRKFNEVYFGDDFRERLPPSQPRIH